MKQAIIIDLDGTLADCNHRLHHLDARGWTEFYAGIPKDPVNQWCLEIIKRFTPQIKIIFLTGRPSEEQIMTDTMTWLDKHLPEMNDVVTILARKEKDHRPAPIIKKEIYEEHIKSEYEILFAIDDDPKVIQMWREQGIIALECGRKQ